MDVAILGNKSLKIKGKGSTIVINPVSSMPKTEAEAILVFKDYEGQDFDKVEGKRIVIKGPGEYEVSGAKISAVGAKNELTSLIDIDNIKVLVGDGKVIEKIQDKIENCNVVIVCADEDFNQSVLASIEPNIILIYGEKKDQVAKSLGKDSAEKISKFSTTLDKLPEDLQVLLLE